MPENYEPKPAAFYLRGDALEVSEHFDQIGHSVPKLVVVAPQHIKDMAGALSHSHSLVRARAAVTLGKIGHREALQPLKAALLVENDGLAKMAMQAAISKIEQPLKT